MNNKFLIMLIMFVFLIPQIGLANLVEEVEQTDEELLTEQKLEKVSDQKEINEEELETESSNLTESEDLKEEVEQVLEKDEEVIGAEVKEDLTEEADEVEEPLIQPKSLVTLRGVALKAPTAVRQSKNQTSKALKTYSKGHILIYREAPGDWYETNVYLNGKRTPGYIYKEDVETTVTNGKRIDGYAQKSPVHVYKKASRSSGALKSYKEGSKLIYREFSKDWYRATVYLKGKPYTGYIHKSDVDLKKPIEGPTLQGYGYVSPTHVYQKTSKSSKSLKSYKKGSKLKYKEYNKNWYKTTVYLKGVPYTGYINKKDIENIIINGKRIEGYAQKSPVRVYKKTNRNSGALKSYKEGSKLIYREYSRDWYRATVYLKGKPHTGYIHKSDVDVEKPAEGPTLQGYGNASPTHVYQKTSTNSKSLKSYKKGSKLKYKEYNKNWYKTTVYLKGVPYTGYINKKDISSKKPTVKPVLQGYAQKAPTAVYSSTSLSSTKLKTYSKGSLLKYREYNANWYITTVYLNGKARTGYIHKSHVGSKTSVTYVNPNKTYTYSQMVKDIKDLKRAYPDLIDYKVVGKSEYGRDIYAVSLGKGNSTAFVNGSLHAREWISSTLNMYMLEQYAKGYTDNKTIRGFNVRRTLNNTTLWFMPMVNPDGVTLQQFGLNSYPKSERNALKRMNNGSTNFKRWKANGKGVDVNRNFSSGWNNVRNDPGKPWHQNYKGPRPMSSKEAKAISGFVRSIKPKMSINYHSSGQVIYWNYNQTGSTYNRDYLRARQISNYTGYTLMGGSRPAGGFMEWFGINMKGTAITPELAPYAGNTNPPLSRFAQIWRENQPVGLYAASQSK